eukprot:9388034-Alexandrium_andersonii.AAC.1
MPRGPSPSASPESSSSTLGGMWDAEPEASPISRAVPGAEVTWGLRSSGLVLWMTMFASDSCASKLNLGR